MVKGLMGPRGERQGEGSCDARVDEGVAWLEQDGDYIVDSKGWGVGREIFANPQSLHFPFHSATQARRLRSYTPLESLDLLLEKALGFMQLRLSNV